jgi:hypothetical protein
VAARGSAIIAPMDGEAYYTVNLRYVVETMWVHSTR